jgi:pimeloyl-ACP methyl ester carboxylesterase
MVHGFASSFERNWREPGWVDILTDEGRKVTGVDLLGHGDAEKPHDPAAYGDLEGSVAAALPPDGQVDAIGFSLGGQLLLRVAVEKPDRFRKIVVGGVADNVFSDSDSELAAHAIETGETSDDHPLTGAFARFALAPGNDRAALAACLRRPRTPTTEEQIGQITADVLVVLGDRDFVGSADRLMKALQNGNITSLHGADHFGTPKDFRFIDAAVEFLRD